MELLAEFDVAAPDVVDILGAIDLHRLHGFSFWDSLILRSAIQSGCSVLLTKDLQKSREVDGVSIVVTTGIDEPHPRCVHMGVQLGSFPSSG